MEASQGDFEQPICTWTFPCKFAFGALRELQDKDTQVHLGHPSTQGGQDRKERREAGRGR
jgi:hypothetical protein